MPAQRRKSTDEPEEIHNHSFGYFGRDLTQQRCRCGALLVSQKEYDLRTAEWEAFWEYQRSSESAQRYFNLRKAWEEKDLVTVKKLSDEAGQALQKDDYQIIYPDYPDPTSAISKYVIKEEWELEERSNKNYPLDATRNFV